MKLFVFDVDGTLVGRDQILKEETIILLNRILRNGDAIAIASGRPFTGIKKYFNFLEDGHKFCICANGAEVRDIDGNVLFSETIELGDYYKFIDNHKNIFNHEHTNIYVYLSEGIGYLKLDKFIESESYYNGNYKMINLTGRDFDLNYPILKFMIATTKEFSLECEKYITKEEKTNFKVLRTSSIFIEFINKNTDKSEGVAFLKEYLSLNYEDIYTFGDSGNDVEMIKEYNGIAMGNATKECKDVAKFITKNVDDGGVIYAFNNFVKY